MLIIHRCRPGEECRCHATANRQARYKAAERNSRPPRESRQEVAWRQKYNQRLLERGLPLGTVMGLDPSIDLAYDPADAADDELYYMAQDAEHLNP